MCVTTTSRITVSIILVVVTTLKERRVVAILILHSNVNVTSVDILIRHNPSLDGERHNDDRCRFRLRPHGKGEIQDGVRPQAVTCRHFPLKWSKIVIDRSQCQLQSPLSRSLARIYIVVAFWTCRYIGRYCTSCIGIVSAWVSSIPGHPIYRLNWV